MFYCKIKSQYKRSHEGYLDWKDVGVKKTMAILRLSWFTGRRGLAVVNQCRSCDNGVESTKHFLLHCTSLNEARAQLFAAFRRVFPNWDRFTDHMKCAYILSSSDELSGSGLCEARFEFLRKFKRNIM